MDIQDIKNRIFKDSKGNNVYMNVSVEEMDWLVEQTEKSGAVNSRWWMMDTIEKQKEELDLLKGQNSSLLKRASRQIDEIAKLKKALKFYADKENYEEWKDVNPEVNYIHNVDFDGGYRARKALEGE